jgi:nicotinate-nucleotide adenylyltransferase
MMSDQSVTAFFGGSFDPPHPGHLGVASGALKSGRCSKVLWVPAFDPPHKQGVERRTFAERVEMVSEMISGFDGMEISDIEKRLALAPSYTFKVMESLEKECNSQLALLIGEDSLAQLHTWFKAHELVEKYLILTYPRTGTTVDMAYLEQFWSKEEAQKLLSGMIDGKFFEISSTEIRKLLAKNAKWSDIKELTNKIMNNGE